MLERVQQPLRHLAAGGALALLVVLTSSCAGVWGSSLPAAPVQPPPGFIFTNFQAPLDFEFTEKGVGTDTANMRMGESEAQFIYVPFIAPGLLRFGWGDASLDTAATNGRIDEIHYADYEVLSVLGIYTNTKIRAYGQ